MEEKATAYSTGEGPKSRGKESLQSGGEDSLHSRRVEVAYIQGEGQLQVQGTNSYNIEKGSLQSRG